MNALLNKFSNILQLLSKTTRPIVKLSDQSVNLVLGISSA